MNAAPELLAVGRLVEGASRARDALDLVLALSGQLRGAHAATSERPAFDPKRRTTPRWGCGSSTVQKATRKDLSPHKLDAVATTGERRPSGAIVPKPAFTSEALDARLRTTLVDRSARRLHGREEQPRRPPSPAGRGGRSSSCRKAGFGLRQELLQFPPDSIVIGLEFKQRRSLRAHRHRALLRARRTSTHHRPRRSASCGACCSTCTRVFTVSPRGPEGKLYPHARRSAARLE